MIIKGSLLQRYVLFNTYPLLFIPVVNFFTFSLIYTYIHPPLKLKYIDFTKVKAAWDFQTAYSITGYDVRSFHLFNEIFIE